MPSHHPTTPKHIEDCLKKLYSDPSKPGSFSGLGKLEATIKKDGLYIISGRQLKAFLEKQDTYHVHRFVRRNFKRSRVIAYGINDLVDIDLADCSRLARYNTGVRFLLVAIDVFSRFVKVFALKTSLRCPS